MDPNEFLRKLASEKWRMLVQPDESNVEMGYRDKRQGGCMVGPLLTVPIHLGIEDDEGESVLCFDGYDGLLALLCLQLPQVADLLAFIDAGLKPGNTQPGFIADLQARTRRLMVCLGDQGDRGEGWHSVGGAAHL